MTVLNRLRDNSVFPFNIIRKPPRLAEHGKAQVNSWVVYILNMDERKKKAGLSEMCGFPISYRTGIKSCVRMYIASKRIELESPGWSGLVGF